MRFWAVFSSELRNDFTKDPKAMFARFENATKWTNHMTDLLHRRIGERHFGCTVLSKNYEGEFWPKVDVAYFDQPGDNWGRWAGRIAYLVRDLHAELR